MKHLQLKICMYSSEPNTIPFLNDRIFNAYIWLSFLSHLSAFWRSKHMPFHCTHLSQSIWNICLFSWVSLIMEGGQRLPTLSIICKGSLHIQNPTSPMCLVTNTVQTEKLFLRYCCPWIRNIRICLPLWLWAHMFACPYHSAISTVNQLSKIFPNTGSYSTCSRLSELSWLFSCCCNTKSDLLTRDCVRIKLYFLKKTRSSVRAIQNLEILDLGLCLTKSRIRFIIFF